MERLVISFFSGGSKVEKLYIDDGGETAYSLSWWKDEASDTGSPVDIELQKTEKNSESMWCLTHGEFIERGENQCGKRQCPTYEPCNGKSGRCKFLKNTLIGTGKFYTVLPNGNVNKR
jgi:hypothetical protein